MDKRRDGHMEEIDIRIYGHMDKWRIVGTIWRDEQKRMVRCS